MEQSSSDLHRPRKPRSLAQRARLVQEVHKSKRWRDEGFRNIQDWSEAHLGYTRRSIYIFLKVARLLTFLTDEHVDRLGFNLAYELACLDAKGKLSPELLERAAKDNPRKFKEEVERTLGRGHKNPLVGEPLDAPFRNLTYAPITEQGVVFVFGMVSHELGFRVEAVQQRYPDCIAKQQVSDKKWRPVRIEFEYLSSSFNHPPEDSDLIVCWEDDLKGRGKKAPLEVLELKSAIEKLPRKFPKFEPAS